MNEFVLGIPDGRLSLDLCLRSGQVFRWRKEEDGAWVGVDGSNWYRLWHGRPAHGFQDRPGLDRQQTILSPKEGSALMVHTNATRDEAMRFFRLDKDAKESERRILELGPELKPAIDTLLGIRLMRPSSLTETVFTFLCTANNNLHRIIPMCWKLGSFGEPLVDSKGTSPTVEGSTLTRFPTVTQIAAIDELELRQAGFGYRGATIPKAAKAILERGAEVWLSELRQADYLDLHHELCTIPGIGPKLADCIALYGYDKGEAVPLDTHIWQAFTRLYHPEWKDKAVTDFRYRESTQRFRDRFGELSGWAHLFLFFENLLNWRERRSI